MAFNIATLWRAPIVNPINRKARSIPILNPFNVYGRVFFFGWWGFMAAFWSWYAFPPLLAHTIRQDLGLSQIDIANSNIIALLATLLVRLVAGPLCDLVGPRYTFALCLLAGSIPTVLAGAVNSVNGLLALRFFIGILGGTFVPCQVWTTGFFDKNIVGTANALTGGWGNAGGGITYFVMPAIFDSLVSNQKLTPHVAWRVSFVVPFIVIVATAVLLLLLCPDTPTGKWSERSLHIPQGNVIADQTSKLDGPSDEKLDISKLAESSSDQKFQNETVISNTGFDQEAQTDGQDIIDSARGEVVVKPTWRTVLAMFLSPQTLVVASAYFCSFGAELAVNSILGAYYQKNFPALGQTGSGNWAAMFGLLNVFFRPFGGMLADIIYRFTHSVWAKKFLVHGFAIVCGAFLVAIGIQDSKDMSTMFGLVAGMAFFLEAGNGAVFSVVPHIHPFANGVVSGITGGAGNFGGIIFSIVFRYIGVDYGKGFWIIGIMTIAINLAVSWIKPIPTNQIGGR